MMGIVNLRYEVDNLRFDAAIDYSKCLHVYPGDTENFLPIELYCLDKDWDIHMMFIKQNHPQQAVVSFEDILNETKEWMEDMSEED